MGSAYLGLGLGGVVSADLTLWLIRRFGWRGAFQIIGLLVLIVLFPVAQWVTRSWPRELGLQPDGDLSPGAADPVPGSEGAGVRRAVRTLNFWLIILGSTLTIGARSEEHTSELQSRLHLVCRLLLEKKKQRHDNRLSIEHDTHPDQPTERAPQYN